MMELRKEKIFTNNQLAEFRLKGDLVLDQFINEFGDKYGQNELQKLMKWATNTSSFQKDEIPEALLTIFNNYSSLPPFTDLVQMEQGFQFFKKYMAAVAILLGCYSLPYCYAGADGAQVLYFSEKIHANTSKRLNDTGDFVREMHSKAAWLSGEAFVRAFKVRVLHGITRFYLVNKGSWNMAWGLPVNQEDMAGTNLAFSFIVLRGLHKLGYQFNTIEAESYLHTWKVIGYFMGLDNLLLTDKWLEAEQLDELISKRNFRASEVGQFLMKSLIDSSKTTLKIPFIKNMPTALMRFCLGDSISEMLKVPKMDNYQKYIKYLPLKLMVRNSTVVRS